MAPNRYFDSGDTWRSGLHGGAVAYAEYALGRVTVNSARYFGKFDPYRIIDMMHEALHLDDGYEAARINDRHEFPKCASMGCPFERAVQFHAKKTFYDGWGDFMKEQL